MDLLSASNIYNKKHISPSSYKGYDGDLPLDEESQQADRPIPRTAAAPVPVPSSAAAAAPARRKITASRALTRPVITAAAGAAAVEEGDPNSSLPPYHSGAAAAAAAAVVVAAAPPAKKASIMTIFLNREGERAACMTICRDTISRLADKQHLQKAQIETLLADRVRQLGCQTKNFSRLSL